MEGPRVDIGKPVSRKLQLSNPEMMVTWTRVVIVEFMRSRPFFDMV